MDTASANSVESKLGCTLRIYFHNVMPTLHNVMLMSHKRKRVLGIITQGSHITPLCSLLHTLLKDKCMCCRTSEHCKSLILQDKCNIEIFLSLFDAMKLKYNRIKFYIRSYFFLHLCVSKILQLCTFNKHYKCHIQQRILEIFTPKQKKNFSKTFSAF